MRVPDSVFKIIVGFQEQEGKPPLQHFWAWEIENQDGYEFKPLEKYLVTLENIEAKLGFALIEDQHKVWATENFVGLPKS